MFDDFLSFVHLDFKPMKKYLLCILGIMMFHNAMSQVVDDFEDADLNLDPAWSGMLNTFTTINGELRSNCSALNSVFYISTPNVRADSTECRIDCRLSFNTSSVNYVDLVLISDSMNLALAKNAYFIRLGGSTDEISLFKLKNGIETKIIDGTDGILNTSNNHYLLIMQRFNDSFVLKYLKSGASSFTERSVKDADIFTSAYCGLRIRQSAASFHNKHFFDNLYIGPVTRDSIAPAWDTANLYDLLITELMIDPEPQVALPLAEYIEVTNVSRRFIQLNGCKIHDPTSFKLLPDLVLAPDSIVVLKIIPSLNNAEDKIWLENQFGEIVHKVDYTDEWYKDEVRKAGGYSLEMIDYTQPCIGFDNWKASVDISGGTPGRLNSVKGNIPKDSWAPSLLECSIGNDSILEFYFNEPVDSISLLSTMFRVNGQLSSFRLKRLNSSGDIVTWLISFTPDKTLVYTILFSGISDCSGNRQMNTEIPLQWPSPSVKGNLLINEVLFNPHSGGSDFVEIYNNSPLAFDLSGHFLADVDEAGLLKSSYAISSKVLLIKPFQYVLISADTANICMTYDCPGANALKIQMNQFPSMPDDEGTILLLNQQKVCIDSLHYRKDWHFPLISDQNGVSLERLAFAMNTNLKDNWHSAASTVGYATPGYRNSQIAHPFETDKYFSLQSKTLSPDEDGFEDVMVLNYVLPGPDYIASIFIYDMEGRSIRHLVNNRTLGTEGMLTWDGTDENGQKTPIGIYIIWIECIHPNGEKIRQKMSVVVAARI